MMRDLAFQHIAQNPWATLKLALLKAVAFWWPPMHTGKYAAVTGEALARLVWLVQFSTICGFFLAATLRIRTFGRQLGGLWLLVIGYTAIHMIFYVIYRYRLPIMPVLCVGAGLSAHHLVARAWPQFKRFLNFSFPSVRRIIAATDEAGRADNHGHAVFQDQNP